MTSVVRRILGALVALALTVSLLSSAGGADERRNMATANRRALSVDNPLLSPEQWSKLDRAVDRGLSYLAKNQEAHGSFPTPGSAQPGVTGLCMMAFLARGHQPGKGPYGSVIERGVDYVLSLQNPQNGALMPDRFAQGNIDNAGNYSHGIAGVLLAEVYGMTDSARHERIRKAVISALDYSRKLQLRPKSMPDERGGWRYVYSRGSADSDLSVTAWQLMFLRSARNAEFDVPTAWVRDAMDYVHRSFDSNQRAFVYGLHGRNRYCTRGMVGAGIVCLELGGEHRSETAKIAGDWILRSSFEPYNNSFHVEDRYHYGAFYCSQAMFQLGGEYWNQFFPRLLKVMAEAQHSDGSWDLECVEEDRGFGQCYTTSLAILALATPYQLLPIYQR